MANSSVFIDGFSAFKPNEKAPDFVIADLSINVKKLFEFLKDPNNVKYYSTDKNGDKVLKLSVKNSAKGTYYADVNTYGTSAVGTAPINKVVSDILPF